MKNPIHIFAGVTILLVMLLSGQLHAQSPDRINYQSVVRNSSGEILANQNVGIRFQIIQSSEFGAAVYVETHTGPTNAFGLINLKIGGGNVLLGSFSGINWDNGPYFLKIEIDPTGGTSYSTTISTTQLLSVPYALHAKTVTTETDPLFSASPASNITSTNISNWNTAYSWDNHAGLYRSDSWVPSWTDVTAKPVIFPPDSHTHAATDITSDTLNIARIPTGSSSSTVALGNHIHGNITNTGRIGSTAGSIITTATDGTLQATAGTAEGQMLYWNGSAWVNVPPGSTGQVLTFINGVPTWRGTGAGINDVYNPTTGKIWMDRNLGATQVAASSTDANSYGHLYQWGRGSDGHQVRTSSTTTTLSSSNTPGHGNFIVASSSPYDWRSPQNDNLWQGINGVNNPCPTGYRLPTDAEWNAERLSWSTDKATGAFASPLKLPVAGVRIYNGSFSSVGSDGHYWSGTVGGTYSRTLYFYINAASLAYYSRGYGLSVRCLKE